MRAGSEVDVVHEGVVDVTDDAFEASVLSSEKPYLLEFWAPWCAPCRHLAPVLEEIAAECGESFVVGKMNVDEHPDAAMRYDVTSVPTLALFRNGEIVARLVGQVNKQRLLEEIAPWVG